MWQKVRSIFLNDKVILSVILLNSVLIYLQVSGVTNLVLDILDTTCTLIFLVEMLVKHRELGIKGYWSDGWNKLDGLLVILSLPSIAALFVPNDMEHLSIFLLSDKFQE